MASSTLPVSRNSRASFDEFSGRSGATPRARSWTREPTLVAGAAPPGVPGPDPFGHRRGAPAREAARTRWRDREKDEDRPCLGIAVAGEQRQGPAGGPLRYIGADGLRLVEAMECDHG